VDHPVRLVHLVHRKKPALHAFALLRYGTYDSLEYSACSANPGIGHATSFRYRPEWVSSERSPNAFERRPDRQRIDSRRFAWVRSSGFRQTSTGFYRVM
jgi:hypothetical protein